MKKFTVRDLFWLVLVVAMGLAWWLDRQRYKDSFDEARRLEMRLEVAREGLRAWHKDIDEIGKIVTRPEHIYWAPRPTQQPSRPSSSQGRGR